MNEIGLPRGILPCALQVCKAGLARVRKIWLTRHGESMYNTQGKLGGNSQLSPRGEIYARLLPDVIVDRIPLVRVVHLIVLCHAHVPSLSVGRLFV